MQFSLTNPSKIHNKAKKRRSIVILIRNIVSAFLFFLQIRRYLLHKDCAVPVELLCADTAH